MTAPLPPPASPPNPSFLAYTPVALAFGTSGLRGLVKDITDLEAFINITGSLRYMQAVGDIQAGSTVILAGDLRPSTDRILRAAQHAITLAGFKVEYAGKIPSPALIYRSLVTGCAGVMVTGSHIPFDRNGIKLNKRRGEVLKSDEAGITAEVLDVRAAEYARTKEASAFDAAGMLKAAPAILPVNGSAEDAYVRRAQAGFAKGALRGLRIVVYQHSAVGRDILARILRELGAEVVTAGRAETFVAIDTENITDEQLARLDGLVVQAERAAGGARVDAIVSTDGDSDRPLVAAVLREPGTDGRRVRFLPGDLLGIVVAELLGADAVAVPISANDAVERRMRERGVLLRKTRIGSPYVIDAIDGLARAGKHKTILGWEANGGFLVGVDVNLPCGTVAALPTRDATLPIVANLVAAAEAGVTLDALWDRLPRRYGRSGLLDEVPTEASRAALDALVPEGDVVEVDLTHPPGITGLRREERDDGSRSELSGEAVRAWQKVRATLERVFTKEHGFGKVERINVMDGLRVYFDNGDVAHVRPSGNAPQLRIYANSDTQARADAIVLAGLREPDGLLRELLRVAR